MQQPAEAQSSRLIRAELVRASSQLKACLSQQYLVSSNKSLCRHLFSQLNGVIGEPEGLQASGN